MDLFLLVVPFLALTTYLCFNWICNLLRLILLSIPSGMSVISRYDAWQIKRKRSKLCKTIRVNPLSVFPNHQKELTTSGHSFVKREDGYNQHMQRFVFGEDTMVSYEIPQSYINTKWFASYPKGKLVSFPPFPLTTYWEKPESSISTFQTTKGRVFNKNEIMILKGLAGPLQRLGSDDAKYVREMFTKEPIVSKEETKPLSRSEQRNKLRMEKVQHESEIKGEEEKLLIVRDNGDIETFNPQVF